MRFFTRHGRRYATFHRLAVQPGLRHAFCLRPHDVSIRSDERAAERRQRRREMTADLHFDPDRLTVCAQVHGGRLHRVGLGDVGTRLEDTDGALCDLAGVPLMTFSADCPLVLLYDPRRRALGMVHASWRCTVAGATGRLVAEMERAYGCPPEMLLAGIGPSAGPCCYEVGDDVFAAAAGLPERDALFVRRNARMYFDLWAANRAQLAAAGVPPAGIETAEVCTMCRNDLFYSYRREGRGCGHFGLVAGLAP